MKKCFFFFVMLMPVLSFGQITFEKGYFIDNSDSKIECLIRNIDWKNNPLSFNYKISETSEIETGNINDIKLFEIYNQAKYVRSTVKIDKSSNNLNKLSETRSPEFVEEQLFLKQLITGDVNLYKYVNGNLVRYFIQEGNKDIEQLIYKSYEIETNRVAYNEDYKIQLQKALDCPKITGKIKTTVYKEKELTALFLKYNQCANPDYQFAPNKNNGVFNFFLRPRLNVSSLEFSNTYSKENFQMVNETRFGFGIEAEYVFPVNKNKWSIVIEPTYQFYNSEKTTDANYLVGGKLITNVDYKSIELPIGIRHYMFLNNKSKIFLNVQYVVNIDFNSSIEFKRADNSIVNSLEIKSRPNYAIGIGYNYNNKYGVEFRYFTNRDITGNYLYWNSKYQNTSIILSYNLF